MDNPPKQMYDDWGYPHDFGNLHLPFLTSLTCSVLFLYKFGRIPTQPTTEYPFNQGKGNLMEYQHSPQRTSGYKRNHWMRSLRWATWDDQHHFSPVLWRRVAWERPNPHRALTSKSSCAGLSRGFSWESLGEASFSPRALLCWRNTTSVSQKMLV